MATTTSYYKPAPSGTNATSMKDDDIPRVVRVGMNRIVEDRSGTFGRAHALPQPCFSYQDGKPPQLLVLDSTWDALVFRLDRCYKVIREDQKKAQIIPVLIFWISYSLILVIGKHTARQSNWPELWALLVSVVFSIYMGYVFWVDKEKLMTKVLKEEELYELFARDGYLVSVERQPSQWGPCGPTQVGVRFERQSR